MQLHDGPIDLVVSGINYGANVGINVYYSGTVAAAMEAAFLRIPSVAMSVAAEEGPTSTPRPSMVSRYSRGCCPCTGDVMNVNVPCSPTGRPGASAWSRRPPPASTSTTSPTRTTGSEAVFRLAGGAHREEKEPADTTALADGYITVTPLLPDMTDHKKTLALRAQLNGANWECDKA
jgi:5'-nucleotidase